MVQFWPKAHDQYPPQLWCPSSITNIKWISKIWIGSIKKMSLAKSHYHIMIEGMPIVGKCDRQSSTFLRQRNMTHTGLWNPTARNHGWSSPFVAFCRNSWRVSVAWSQICPSGSWLSSNPSNAHQIPEDGIHFISDFVYQTYRSILFKDFVPQDS